MKRKQTKFCKEYLHSSFAFTFIIFILLLFICKISCGDNDSSTTINNNIEDNSTIPLEQYEIVKNGYFYLHFSSTNFY